LTSWAGSPKQWIAAWRPRGGGGGYNDALWQRHYDGASWGDWSQDAGGYLLSGPGLAAQGDGQFDVFVAGVYSGTGAVYTETATSLYQRHWDGTAWSADWDIVDVEPADGVSLVDAPAAVAHSTDQLDLFRRAGDATLRWLHYDGTAWGSWQNLGGLLLDAPTAISLGGDQVQVFVRGVDGRLWYRTYDGTSWGAWQCLVGLNLSAAPTAVSPAGGQVDVYARGEDEALWRIRFDGNTWSGWENLQGRLGSGAAVAVYGSEVELFAQTTDDPDTEPVEPVGSLQQKHYDGATWTDWQDVGGLEVSFAYHPGLPADVVDVTTGYFSGDGREQIVLAYGQGSGYTVRLYDVDSGFSPSQLASYSWSVAVTQTVRHIAVATGDVDVQDGRDEILVSFIQEDTSVTELEWSFLAADVRYDPGQELWQIVAEWRDVYASVTRRVHLRPSRGHPRIDQL
jgi:hypothetical protein